MRTRNLTFLLLFFVINTYGLCGDDVVGAEDELSALPPIVIIGTGLPVTPEKTPHNVAVITRDELDEQHPHSLADALRNVPGVYVDQSGSRGGVGSVYMRGSDPNHAMILIDGVKINDPTNSRGGSVNLSTINVETIERIEIISGPLSSVYGSDALGGVINIITRKGSDTPEFILHGGIGSQDAYKTGMFARGPIEGRGGYVLQLDTEDDGNGLAGNQYQGHSVVASLHNELSDNMRVSTSLRYIDSHSESFPDDSGGPNFSQIRDVDRRDVVDTSIGINFRRQLRHGAVFMLKGDWLNHEETMDSPGVAPGVRDPFGIPPNSSENVLDRYTLASNAQFEMAEDIRLNIGVDHQHEYGVSDSTLVIFNTVQEGRFDLERDILGVFTELEFHTLYGLTLQGGWRQDDAKGFGTVSSPRMGIVYHRPSSQTMLKANWGKGFKLPSFFALGNPIVGNPALLPETSDSIEMGVDQHYLDGKMRIGVDIFHSRYFNIIDFEEGPPPQLVNRNEVSAQGFEVSTVFHPARRLRVDAHVSHVVTDIKGTDEELRNRPEWQASTGLRWMARTDVVMNLDIHYVGEILDSSIPTGDRMLDSYIRTDVNVLWKISGNTDVSVSIDNAFDTEYEERIGFPAPGITGRITAHTRL